MDVLAIILQDHPRFQAASRGNHSLHTRLKVGRQFPGDTAVNSVLSRFVPGHPADQGPSPTKTPTSTSQIPPTKATNTRATPPTQTQTRTETTGITTPSTTPPPESDQSFSTTDTEDATGDLGSLTTQDDDGRKSGSTSRIGLAPVALITVTEASISMTTTIVNQTSTTTRENGKNIVGVIAGSVVGAVVLLLILMCAVSVSPLRIGTPSLAQNNPVNKLQAESWRDRIEDDHDGRSHTATHRGDSAMASDEMLGLQHQASPPPSYMP
ncbi:hypothetical protein L218DRAFT_951488 [Marasmius fiardii PR-910]|nr:hypothetical protein L218DRAFT_951488 [Marasmius fiardii PR-910]